MNIKNAFGFFVLGLAMHTTPLMAQAVPVNVLAAEPSVRAVWLEFMSWVIGGIGLGYIARDGILRTQNFVIPLAVRLLRPFAAQPEPVQFQPAVRVGQTY